MCRQRRAPFIPISAPTLPSLGIPPPSRRGKHGQCALHVPSAHFDAPEHATRLHHENLAGLSLISPTPQLRQIKGLVATRSPPSPSPVPFSPARPLKSHQGTPELDASSSVWNRPSKHPYVSLRICRRHGSR